MLYVLRTSWALLLGLALLMIGNGLQGTLLGVRGSLEAISADAMGYVMSAYYVGFLLASYATPVMLRRVGHVRVFAALGSLISGAFILYATLVHPLAWLVLRLIVGFCMCGVYVVAESWLNHAATNDTRGQAMSAYLIVQMLGIVAGQMMLNVADPAGYDLFVLMTVLVSISIAPMLLSAQPAPVTQTDRKMSFRELFAASPLGCFGALMLGGVFSALFAMSPIYATERGLSVSQTSWFVSAIFIGGLVLQYPVGWLSDRIDRRKLIIANAAVGALAGLVGARYGDDFRVLLSVAFVLGGIANPLYSLLIAHTHDYLPLDQMASASAGLLFINGFGAMFGPIVVGFLMSALDPVWFFVSCSILLATLAGYGLWRSTRRPAVPLEAQVPYVPISARATYLTANLAAEAAIDTVARDEPSADPLKTRSDARPEHGS